MFAGIARSLNKLRLGSKSPHSSREKLLIHAIQNIYQNTELPNLHTLIAFNSRYN